MVPRVFRGFGEHMAHKEPKSAILTRLDPGTVRAVDEIAKDRDWTRSQVVRHLVCHGLEAGVLEA